jgi:hypothetical protein
VIDEFDHPVFGFGNGEVAKLDTRASHAAFAKVARLPVESASVNSR